MRSRLPLGRARRAAAAAAPSASSSSVASDSKSARPFRRRRERRRRPSVVVAAAGTSPSRPPPPIRDPVSPLVPVLRSSPLYLASAGVASVLVNRLFFSDSGGSGAVALDAASAQSRAELVAVALSAALALTGLQWLTIAPKTPEPVALEDFEVLDWVSSDGETLSNEAAEEIRWAATALRSACPSCISLTVFVDGNCVAKVGSFRKSSANAAPTFGDVCTRAFEAEPQAGTYLANLVLYPGRDEFLSYLPDGTRGVAVAPAGRVLLVAATNVVRGFAAVDQAWVATLAEKVDAAVGE